LSRQEGQRARSGNVVATGESCAVYGCKVYRHWVINGRGQSYRKDGIDQAKSGAFGYADVIDAQTRRDRIIIQDCARTPVARNGCVAWVAQRYKESLIGFVAIIAIDDNGDDLGCNASRKSQRSRRADIVGPSICGAIRGCIVHRHCLTASGGQANGKECVGSSAGVALDDTGIIDAKT
jgi:hypothetical protein